MQSIIQGLFRLDNTQKLKSIFLDPNPATQHQRIRDLENVSKTVMIIIENIQIISEKNW